MARHYLPSLRQENLVVLQSPRPNTQLDSLKLSRMAAKLTGSAELLADQRDRGIDRTVVPNADPISKGKLPSRRRRRGAAV